VVQLYVLVALPLGKNLGTNLLGVWMDPNEGLVVAVRENIRPSRASNSSHVARNLVSKLTEVPRFETL
jgi:hypothetical protein